MRQGDPRLGVKVRLVPLTVLISGAGGLLGTGLARVLRARGDRVVRLVRRPAAGPDEIRWDPGVGVIDAPALEGLDAVVHLSGEPIAAVRWTRPKKTRIYDSRVRSGRVLAQALAGLSRRPRVLVSQSASGYYGDGGAEVLTEERPPGNSFLARLCADWEAAADSARHAGIRVVHPRSANVLSAADGYLGPLLLLFRFGLGGRLGNGRQYVPWITLDDWVAAAGHALTTETLEGPVNFAAPQAVTNREFTRALAKVLHRPAVFAAPAFAIRLVMGEFGAEILDGQRLDPGKLLASGFTFRDPSLEGALRRLLH